MRTLTLYYNINLQIQQKHKLFGFKMKIVRRLQPYDTICTINIEILLQLQKKNFKFFISIIA